MAKLAEETGGETEYGISIGVDAQFGSTFGGQTPNTELQRTVSSTSSAATPSTDWATIHTGFGNVAYEDELAASNTRYFYRARHTQTGTSPSTWLGVVDAQPTQNFRV